MILISLTLCFIAFEQTRGNPLPSTSPVTSDKKNVTLDAAVQGDSTKLGSSVDPMKNLSMDKINFIMYAGRVISTLHRDPKYEEMKGRLKDTSGEAQTLLNLMVMMSDETREKLNKVKLETIQILEEQNKGPKSDLKPDYIDFHEPDKFSVIDLDLVTSKVASMRSLFEQFIHGMPGSH